MNDHEPTTTARTGFFPLVSGEVVEMQQCGTMAVLARGDVTLTQGGAQLLLAGGDLTVNQGGGRVIASKGNVSIHQGCALLAGGAKVEAHESWVGIVLGGHVDLTNSRVLLGPVPTLAMGAAIGVAAALTHRLLNRSKA